jgi:hypothetical protein
MIHSWVTAVIFGPGNFDSGAKKSRYIRTAARDKTVQRSATRVGPTPTKTVAIAIIDET